MAVTRLGIQPRAGGGAEQELGTAGEAQRRLARGMLEALGGSVLHAALVNAAVLQTGRQVQAEPLTRRTGLPRLGQRQRVEQGLGTGGYTI